MKSVWNIVRRFGALLMMVAMLAMSVQAAVASAGVSGPGDCLNHSEAHHGAAHDVALTATHHPDSPGHGDKLPCKSACCGSICAMAMPAISSLEEGVAEHRELPGLPVSLKIEGVDLDGLSRPPKALPAV